MKGFALVRTHFETEAQGNLEKAYYRVTQQKNFLVPICTPGWRHCESDKQ